ncbi:hypothetical protein [Lysinibacillus sp. NPDC096259]
MKNTLGNNNDLIIREMTIGKAEKYALSIIYVNSLSNTVRALRFPL